MARLCQHIPSLIRATYKYSLSVSERTMVLGSQDFVGGTEWGRWLTCSQSCDDMLF